jgi:hypothetical protein
VKSQRQLVTKNHTHLFLSFVSNLFSFSFSFSFVALDALTHCLEAFVSNKSNPITDALCREAFKRAARSLRTAVEHRNEIEAREGLNAFPLLQPFLVFNASPRSFLFLYFFLSFFQI